MSGMWANVIVQRQAFELVEDDNASQRNTGSLLEWISSNMRFLIVNRATSERGHSQKPDVDEEVREWNKP